MGLFSSTSQIAQSLFLQSHGLRDPLTAVLWGSNRLRGEHKKLLTEEQQQHLIDQVYLNAKILSTMVESFALLAQIEDKLSKVQKQDICLRDLFSSLIESFAYVEDTQWDIRCNHLHIESDRTVLELLLRCLFTLRAGLPTEPVQVMVAVENDDRQLRINFFSSLVFPIVESAQENQLIGGTSGLLLSLADALAKTLKGSVQVERKVAGNFVPLHRGDDVNMSELPSKQFKLVLDLPLVARPVEGQCTPGRSTRKDLQAVGVS